MTQTLVNVRGEGEGRGEGGEWRNLGEEEGNADYGGMVQSVSDMTIKITLRVIVKASVHDGTLVPATWN